ncbi:histidine phosphatase superfamily [Scleroderma yunnanense]
MFIPVNLLQVALSSLTRIFASTEVDLLHDRLWQRFGNLAPYHDREDVWGVCPELPSDCSVEQVMMLHRHGSRGPVGEQDYINKLVQTLENATLPQHLPWNLRFLRDGYHSDLVSEQLTRIGREQLFDHGVQFALQYPTFYTKVLLSSNVTRVVDSAYYFGLGYGKPTEIETVDQRKLPVNWILPWESCPKYDPAQAFKNVFKWVDKYVPPITNRLNKLLPGVGLTDEDVQGALNACAYDLAAHGVSPWCGAFLLPELWGFEYQADLMMDGMSGHRSLHDAGAVVGTIYVNKLIERFTNATGKAEELYLEFGHDLTILVAMAAMNLNKDRVSLSPDHIQFPRKFRTSDQTPFAAWMVWEKFSCKKSFHGPQIRLLLNSATYPLRSCQKSYKDWKYGTCSLDEFVTANSYSTNIHYHDKTWNASCEL